MLRKHNIWQAMGPGLLYAGAAVGVSHLVQSTKAGAVFGYELLWVVFLANILKYPFFEFGPRYASQSGESLLMGYYNNGKWMLWLYLFTCLATMLPALAAVCVVTAGIAKDISATSSISVVGWTGMILGVVAVLLAIGKYKLLDKLIKPIIVALTLTTIIAVMAAWSNPTEKQAEFMSNFDFGNTTHVLFFVALFGWMPAPLDVSIWHSMWTVEKQKLTGQASVKNSLLDFKIGYWGTTFLAVAFVLLGYFVLYGTGIEMAQKADAFSAQVISLYTTSIGQWAYFIIAVAALCTMISTTLTCLDAYPRTINTGISILIHGNEKQVSKKFYLLWLGIAALGAFLFIALFSPENMVKTVVFATALSFVAAPIVSGLNLLVIKQNANKQIEPIGRNYFIFSMICLILLTLFTLYYLYVFFYLG
ncbi:MAG: NRAMP family divalent metal transporter [Flavobacteriales bacterium]